ncbi:MAG: hypothetical protein JRF33_24345 [Deltaproteobacteria bacterium]|nr:hypothetical protein [Deltaproteobacteria bacterium]
MGYDRPSWKDIDRQRDGSSGRRKGKDKKEQGLQQHSTRYDKYKRDLDRLFDQGLAGELLKKTAPDEEPEVELKKESKKSKGPETTRRRNNERIPRNPAKSASRLKFIRAVVDAADTESLINSLDALVADFGLPDDLEVLMRVLEHTDEALILRAVAKIDELRQGAKRIPRKASSKERLRFIGQTAASGELRKVATALEEQL